MPSPHRINIVVPSRSFIQEAKKIAKKNGMNISRMFRKAFYEFRNKTILEELRQLKTTKEKEDFISKIAND